MTDYEYQSAEITLRFEVRRNRPSVTQGSASVYINGDKVITFGDEIEIIKPGERYYGERIGDWASKKPDANFIRGLLFHPYDEVYHYSDSVKKIIDALCEAECPGTIRAQSQEGGHMKLHYIGMDSWDRPVYEDENGILVKDVNPRKCWPPKLCKALNNAFDGEPDVPYHGEPEFVPERVTWTW